MGKFKFIFLAKNAQKNAKKNCVSGPLGNLKTYLDAKFQLIWPSNEARASIDHFFWPQVYVCVWSHYTLLNLCKNLAMRGPFGPSLRSVLIKKIYTIFSDKCTMYTRVLLWGIFFKNYICKPPRGVFIYLKT